MKWQIVSASRCRAGTAAVEQRQLIPPGQVGAPGKGPSQPLDRGELGLGVAFDLQGPFKQFRMVLAQPVDLVLLVCRAEEARALDRDRQSGLGDDLLALFAVVA